MRTARFVDAIHMGAVRRADDLNPFTQIVFTLVPHVPSKSTAESTGSANLFFIQSSRRFRSYRLPYIVYYRNRMGYSV